MQSRREFKTEEEYNMNFPEVLRSDLSAKFGGDEFKFYTTSVGDNVIEVSKETTPALLRYLKE